MRGDLVSRPLVDIMDEAQRLLAAGVKELLVISQDTSAYGTDLPVATGAERGAGKTARFIELVEALSELDAWVRLHYVYPYPHVEKVLPLMAQGKLLPYLDVPFQHASARILQLMKRPAHAERNLERVEQWRSVCPDLTIRSTFIVGFPGESDQEFEELLSFLRAAKLDRVGCFEYSDVPGARANDLPGAVDEKLKSERQQILMETQAEISRTRLASKIGKRFTVLVDQRTDDLVVARGQGDAPEIDGVVYVDLPQAYRGAQVGDWLDVEISEAGEHDLWAVVAE